jgi:hypothetical protein
MKRKNASRPPSRSSRNPFSTKGSSLFWPDNSHFSKSAKYQVVDFTQLPWGVGTFVIWQEVDVCLLCGDCFVCYDVKRVCHKVKAGMR